MGGKEPGVRTFILGAGASKHANGRMADELLPPPSDLSRFLQSDEERLSVVDHALNILSRHTIPTGRMTFEEVLTEIDVRRLSRNAATREVQELNLARRLLVAYALSVSSPDTVRDEGATMAFCKCLAPGDVIVTFNYDILLEQALWDLGMWTLKNGYGFDAPALFRQHMDIPKALRDNPERGLVQVLKPHGSVNWRSMPLEGESSDNGLFVGIIFNSRDLHGLRKEVALYKVAPLMTGGGDAPEAFLMPSYVKSYATTVPFMREIWHLAYERIRRSSEIWIVGYSIPEADTDAHLLLSAADPSLEPVFRIVDPCADEVAKRLRRLVPRLEKKIETKGLRFEECEWSELLG